MNLLANNRLGRILVWFSAAVFVGGLIVFLATRTGSEEEEPTRSAQPAAQQPATTKGKAATLDADARRVASKFILTAVARREVGESYPLVTADLRQGMTLAQWKTGEIPVIPYEVDSINQARFKVEEAYPDELLLQVALIPRKGSDARPTIFHLGLKDTAAGSARNWLVDYWMPRWSPPIPAAPG